MHAHMHEPSHRSIPSIRPCMHLCRVRRRAPVRVVTSWPAVCGARSLFSAASASAFICSMQKKPKGAVASRASPAVCVVERKRACSGDAMCEIGRRVSLSALGERSIFVSESGRRCESNEGRAGLYNTGAVRSVAAAGRG